jgi:hypothetical protein
LKSSLAACRAAVNSIRYRSDAAPASMADLFPRELRLILE